MKPEFINVTLPCQIANTEDALHFALCLADVFPRAFSVVLLNPVGDFVDSTIFTAQYHSIATAIDHAKCLAIDGKTAVSAVMFSVFEGDVTSVNRADNEMFVSVKRFFDEYDIELFEWIQSDHKNFRLMSMTPDI